MLTLFEEDDFDYQPRQMIPKHRLLLFERVNGTAPGQRFLCDSITGGGRFIGFDGHRNQHQGFG